MADTTTIKTTIPLSFEWYFFNIIVAFFGSAVLALMLSLILTESILYALKVVRYQRLAFAPFEAVFVATPETADRGRLASDYTLHPDVFVRKWGWYTVTVDDITIEFDAKRAGFNDVPCDAKINGQPIGCESIRYFAEPNSQYFLRLVGDTDILKTQASDLSAPHWPFTRFLEVLRPILLATIPIGLLVGVVYFGRWLRRRWRPNNPLRWWQSTFLLTPWVIGMTFWTLLTLFIDSVV